MALATGSLCTMLASEMDDLAEEGQLDCLQRHALMAGACMADIRLVRMQTKPAAKHRHVLLKPWPDLICVAKAALAGNILLALMSSWLDSMPQPSRLRSILRISYDFSQRLLGGEPSLRKQEW